MYVLCVVELNYVVESLVGRRKGKKRTNYLFYFITRNVRWFVYPQIMDGSDNMGGGDSSYGNGDYKR